MKVGDLVRFRRQPDPAVGLVVEINNKPRRGWCPVGVRWDFLLGKVGYQNPRDLEVISESR